MGQNQGKRTDQEVSTDQDQEPSSKMATLTALRAHTIAKAVVLLLASVLTSTMLPLDPQPLPIIHI